MTLIDDAVHSGQWRLARIELVNWGTFHGHTRIDVARRGHLFIGASGSGKSSLLDAIATVLTPQGKIRYNAAAQDATSRGDDRSLVSYVRGAWSKQADELDDRAVSAYLRTGAVWSGILLRFENGLDQPVGLARLFHLRAGSNDKADVKDLAFVDRGEVSLLEFQPHVGAGVDARAVKRAWPGAVVTSGGAHKPYFARATRLLGIGSENALLLLHKTQAAKNLGSLDRLFRDFMLDTPPTFARARTAIEQFGDLSEAHRLVKRAREQVELLRSLDPAIDAYETNTAEAAEARRLQDLLEPYQVRLTLRLADDELAQAHVDRAAADGLAAAAADRHDSAQRALRAAEQRTSDVGGAAAEQARERLDRARADEARVRTDWQRFADALAGVGIPDAPKDATAFAALLAAAKRELDEAHELPKLHEHADQQAYFTGKAEVARLEKEIGELSRRRSNLPAGLLTVRHWLAEQLGVSETVLPFAGELIEVREAHAEWTGAIERVLRPLSTTLLVRSDRLASVRRLVEGRDLRERLVFEEVPAVFEPARPVRSSASLLHRIEVAEGPFRDWLNGRLSAQFDYDCVDGPDDLEAVARGVTIGGQVKSGPRRYEKDDRHRLDDRERWVLGGDNDAKLQELRTRLKAAEGVRDASGAKLADAERERAAVVKRRAVLEGLLSQRWDDLDRTTAADRVVARHADLDAATSENPELHDAMTRLENARSAYKAALEELTGSEGNRQRLGDRIDDLASIIDRSRAEAAQHPALSDVDAQALEERYRAVQRRVDRSSVGGVGVHVGNTLRKEGDRASALAAKARSEFEAGAHDFRERFPEASASLVASIDARADFRSLCERIETRGLPDHEASFLRLLRDKSRDVIGVLLSDLRDAPREVRDRIDPVNVSLRRSEFDLGRTLHIRVKEQRSAEVSAFIADLRAIVEGSWAEEDLAAAEQRYAVLERVMGRLMSSARDDVTWAQRCLDTREHVTFQAQELDAAGTVLAVHDSSAGLSGGQRQKLVIFCLAAALRYQLTDDESDVPGYGTIVLDEAFDKADSTYTRMALDIFEEFGFHMLLATPQKLLTTIEPYVGAVTAISNETRRQSTVANVDWERRGPATDAPAADVSGGGPVETTSDGGVVESDESDAA